MNRKSTRRILYVLLTLLALGALLSIRSDFSLSPSKTYPLLTQPAPPARAAPTRLTLSPSPSPESSQAYDDFLTHRWLHLSSAKRGALRDTLLASFLEKLAATDPQRALSFAMGETDSTSREQLMEAALRGWGTSYPEEALVWARSQTMFDRGLSCSAVIHGAAKAPDRALKLVSILSLEEPEHAEDYSRYLVAAFSQSGRFHQAAAFAASSATEFRTNLMMDAYSRWTQTDPLAAIASASSLHEDDTRKDATSAVLARWAGNDPAAAADYALELDSESERKYALTIALPAWTEKDPAAARAWIARFEPSPALDSGMAAIATAPNSMERPDSAMIWAESIVASRLRILTQSTILKQWATTDPSAARRYADSIPELSSEERALLLSAFKPSFQPDQTVQFP